MEVISSTKYNFKGQTGFYRGKVRDVYYFEDKILAIASDRISAFDVVLPKSIPYKGQVLNQIAAKFLKETSDIVPNWLQSVPDPNVTLGLRCEPYAVEIVVRGYLAGHAAREYNLGKRILCGVALPDGLKENDKLPNPIITPSTKAATGHDEDISKEDILKQGLISQSDYAIIEQYAHALYNRGNEIAGKNGLILVDTKYEFGKKDGKIYLIDEVHTPDSSRYFYKEGYEERQRKGEHQRQLSKEFVRQWLIENNFQGKEGQHLPEMSDDIVKMISERYIELYEKATGERFIKADNSNIEERIEKNILNFI